ncbi:hypothetical protein D3C76_1307090 [compost metagenome]
MRRLKRHTFYHSAGEFNRWRIAVITWVEANHLIAGTHQRGNRCIQRFRRARRHGDFTVSIRLVAIQFPRFVGDRFTQRQCARHRRILIRTHRNVVSQPFLQIPWPIKIRESLRKINGVVLLSQGAHLRKDSRTQVGKFALRNQRVIAHCIAPACNTYVADTITRC